MHRRDLVRAIAHATGDTINTIKRHGFHLEAASKQEISTPLSNEQQPREIINFTRNTYCQWEPDDQ